MPLPGYTHTTTKDSEGTERLQLSIYSFITTFSSDTILARGILASNSDELGDEKLVNGDLVVKGWKPRYTAPA